MYIPRTLGFSVKPIYLNLKKRREISSPIPNNGPIAKTTPKTINEIEKIITKL